MVVVTYGGTSTRCFGGTSDGIVRTGGTSVMYLDPHNDYSRFLEVKPKSDPKKKNKKFWHKFNSYRMDGKF